MPAFSRERGNPAHARCHRQARAAVPARRWGPGLRSRAPPASDSPRLGPHPRGRLRGSVRPRSAGSPACHGPPVPQRGAGRSPTDRSCPRRSGPRRESNRSAVPHLGRGWRYVSRGRYRDGRGAPGARTAGGPSGQPFGPLWAGRCRDDRRPDLHRRPALLRHRPRAERAAKRGMRAGARATRELGAEVSGSAGRTAALLRGSRRRRAVAKRSPPAAIPAPGPSRGPPARRTRLPEFPRPTGPPLGAEVSGGAGGRPRAGRTTDLPQPALGAATRPSIRGASVGPRPLRPVWFPFPLRHLLLCVTTSVPAALPSVSPGARPAFGRLAWQAHRRAGVARRAKSLRPERGAGASAGRLVARSSAFAASARGGRGARHRVGGSCRPRSRVPCRCTRSSETPAGRYALARRMGCGHAGERKPGVAIGLPSAAARHAARRVAPGLSSPRHSHHLGRGLRAARFGRARP